MLSWLLFPGLRVACKLGRQVLDEAAKAVDVGVTTDEIDRIVHEATIDRECYPSPLNYYQFPKSCCTSLNEVICHGIPDLRPMQDGDIVNIDGEDSNYVIKLASIAEVLRFPNEIYEKFSIFLKRKKCYAFLLRRNC
jgi:hypothetical protein